MRQRCRSSGQTPAGRDDSNPRFISALTGPHGKLSPAVSTPRFPDLPGKDFADAFARVLLDWFGKHRRELPWRQIRDPYAIWVSEVMLQQTQAATVVGYYQRFLQAFPDVQSLARAPTQEVLRLWQGLGYYRRALALQEAARLLVRDYQGQLPRDPQLWQQLPGVGRYTAHAILSQAFDLPLPIVEANSARVYARIFVCDQPLESPTAQRWLWHVAECLLPTHGAGHFNQAIMELGATVCMARRPHCEQCPVTAFCRAYQEGRTASFPVRRQRPETSAVNEIGIVVQWRSRWLLLQRTAQAERWPSLWEFPHAEMRPGELADDAVLRVGHELTGLEVVPNRFLARIGYSVTRFRLVMQAWSAIRQAGRIRLTPLHTQARWLTPQQTLALPLSTPQRRLLAVLVDQIL